METSGAELTDGALVLKVLLSVCMDVALSQKLGLFAALRALRGWVLNNATNIIGPVILARGHVHVLVRFLSVSVEKSVDIF